MGGTLTDSYHHLLALWAANCAEHLLHLFEQANSDDKRPRQAIALAAGQAVGVAHVAAHELGSAAYAIRAVMDFLNL